MDRLMQKVPSKQVSFGPEERDVETQLRDLRLFASYSPSQVLLRYAAMKEPHPPSEPECMRFPAAIGFVDVSGFTALAEKLNKEHKRKGAELLNQCASPPCVTNSVAHIVGPSLPCPPSTTTAAS